MAVLVTLMVTLLQIVPPRSFQCTIDSGIKPTLNARGGASAHHRRVDQMRNAPTGVDNVTDSVIRETEAKARVAEERARQSEAESKGIILWTAIALFGVILLRNVFSFANSYVLTWIGHRFVFDLR